MKTQQINKILLMRAQNLSYDKIAELTGYCPRTITRVVQKYKVELTTRKSAEMEHALKQFEACENDRMLRQVKHYSRLTREFDSRPLSDISPERLLRMVALAQKQLDKLGVDMEKRLESSLRQFDPDMEVDFNENRFEEGDSENVAIPQIAAERTKAEDIPLHSQPINPIPQTQNPSPSAIASIFSKLDEAKSAPQKVQNRPTSNLPTVSFKPEVTAAPSASSIITLDPSKLAPQSQHSGSNPGTRPNTQPLPAKQSPPPSSPLNAAKALVSKLVINPPLLKAVA